MKWYDEINETEEAIKTELIPVGTIAKVQMSIKRGGYSDEDMGWDDDYAYKNPETGSIYLNVKFTVLSGEYNGREIWGKIGLHSPRGEAWARMGKTFIKGVLSSAKGVGLFEKTPEAKNAHKLHSFTDIDDILFLAQIDVERDPNGSERNIIKRAITKDHKDYETLMGTKTAKQETSLSPPIWI